MRFVKMHACGNDYVYIDCFVEAPPTDPVALARAISDRHTGVGADGLILLLPPPDADSDARMRMWNADGSASAMCGNGLRCIAALAYNRGHLPGPAATFFTDAGLRQVLCHVGADDRCRRVSVDMGAPILEPAGIPIDPSAAQRVVLEPLPILSLAIDAEMYEVHCVGMGNPHAVIFCPSVDRIPLAELGPRLERHPAFPQRTNIEWVSLVSAGSHSAHPTPRLRQRTWERGSGITRACGSGACAVAVAAIASGCVRAGNLDLDLDGGQLTIGWDGHGAVHMHGEAIEVFTGDWPSGG